VTETVLADAAAIMTAAHDVRRLVHGCPDRVIWSPGRAIWGIALIPGSSRVVISLDGCLDMAATIWPGHFDSGASYPLDAVARALSNAMGIKRLDGSVLFSCTFAGATSGSCCIIVTHDQLPWLSPDIAVKPLRELTNWRSPDIPARISAVRPSRAPTPAKPLQEDVNPFSGDDGSGSEAWISTI
jgi:hypothetical protein